MMEVLCGRTPAVLHTPDLKRALFFYGGQWGFEVQQHIPHVFAVLQRESVTVRLWQLRADMAQQQLACRLLVNDIGQWQGVLHSAPGEAPHASSAQAWGAEFALSDCDGNRLQLVQSAPHRLRQRART